MDIKKYIQITGLGIAATLFLLPTGAVAQTSGTGSGSDTGGFPSGTNTGGSSSGVNTSGTVSIQNPLAANDFCELIEDVYNAVFAFLVPLAVLAVVYGGLRLVFARGKPDKLNEAKKTLLYIFVGIAVFFCAFYLMLIIFNTLVALGGSDFNTCL